MERNFLKGVLGDTINLCMAAAAFNFRTWLRRPAQLFALIWGSSCRDKESFMSPRRRVTASLRFSGTTYYHSQDRGGTFTGVAASAK